MKRTTAHKSKTHFDETKVYRGDCIRKEILSLIQQDHPDFTLNSYISLHDLNAYRKQYLMTLVDREIGEINELEKEVIDAMTKNKLLSENIEADIEKKLTFAQQVADIIAKFGGSWTFIICFFGFMAGWIALNMFILLTRPFDPYPFILLNLLLSCLAAVQAPIILMSQNRVEEKDRRRGEHDYKVNLKAELEIRMLDEKINHLITHQYKRMFDIQQLQLDYLEDILKKLEK